MGLVMRAHAKHILDVLFIVLMNKRHKIVIEPNDDWGGWNIDVWRVDKND